MVRKSTLVKLEANSKRGRISSMLKKKVRIKIDLDKLKR